MMQFCSETLNEKLDISIQIIDSVIAIIVILFALFENIFVLLLLWKHRHFRTPTDIFIACLTVADLFVITLPVPFFIGLYIGKWNASQPWQQAYHVVDTISSTISITCLSILAFDRYFIIVHPYIYQRKITLNLSLIMVASIWVYGISTGVLRIVFSEETFSWFTILVLYGWPISLIIFCHVNVAIIAKQHAKKILKLQVHKTSGKGIKERYSVLRKLSKAKFHSKKNDKKVSIKSNHLKINSEIEIDYSSECSVSTNSSRQKTEPTKSDSAIQVRNLSRADSSSIRFRVSLNYSNVTLQKNIEEIVNEERQDEANKEKNGRKKLPPLARRSKILSYINEELNDNLSEQNPSNSTDKEGSDAKKPEVEPAKQEVLKHSMSSPQISLKSDANRKLKATLKKSDSLPFTNAAGQPTLGRQFRHIVRRNIDKNRQKRLIREEVMKIIHQIRRLRRELKAAILLTIVMVIFLCLWMPFWYIHIMVIGGRFDGTDKSHCLLLKYFKLLHYVNATINPVYYVLLNSKLRNACKTLFESIRYRNKRKVRPEKNDTTDAI
ncbi:D(2) dopamine receptor A-like [Clytia hemisphaerica]|eukprot:TCONS_00004819-protein